MQISVAIGDNLAAIETGDTTHPSIEEIETYARICLHNALQAYSAIDYLISQNMDDQ